MKNILIAFVGAALLTIAIASGAVLLKNSSKGPVGTGFDQSCAFKNVTSADASSTASVVIRGGAGILCGLTIASSSPVVASGIRVYDGTATSTGTLIGTFRPDGSAQTFNLDVAVRVGVVLDVPVTYNGSMIVTSR